jgi:hypothetical protein
MTRCDANKRERDKRHSQARRDRLYRCGHPRTAHRSCPVCHRERQREAMRRTRVEERATRQIGLVKAPKREPKAVRWISTMTPVQLAEARELLERAMAKQQAKVGRPRKVA